MCLHENSVCVHIFILPYFLGKGEVAFFFLIKYTVAHDISLPFDFKTTFQPHIALVLS